MQLTLSGLMQEMLITTVQCLGSISNKHCTATNSRRAEMQGLWLTVLLLPSNQQYHAGSNGLSCVTFLYLVQLHYDALFTTKASQKY